MYGVVDGVYFCNEERLDEINSRIAKRNIPSAPLKPEFSPRPVSTKYAILPILDRRAPIDVPLKDYELFNTEKIFNPGTAQAPWDGFAANINVDSVLRNQFFALQKCPEAFFVPSSTSSLYQSYLATNGKLNENFGEAGSENLNCSFPKSTEIFHNSTRYQRTEIKNNIK